MLLTRRDIVPLQQVPLIQYKGLPTFSLVFMGHVATTLSSHSNLPSKVPKLNDLDRNNLGSSFGIATDAIS
jgi:hypothetical protein